MTPYTSKLLMFASALLAMLAIAPTDADAIGLMIPKDTAVRPFDVESHRVDVTITNTAAVTKINQTFRNHTNRPMEATFVFPIPEGATVSDFSLWINGKKTPGAVLEKNEARRIYESIVRRVRDPGLIEYMDGKLFRASIFPIPPKGTQKLEIKFGQVLQKRGGMYRYTYPLSVGNDYVAAKTEKDFTLTARVLSPIPITTMYSPTHKVSVHRKSPKQAILGMEEMYTSLDRDFELFVGLSKADIGLNVMTHDPDGAGGDNGYFMMALAPRVDAAAHAEIGQTFTFVMDTSGSMAGEKIEQARKTLDFCLKRLRPQDSFNVIRFSTDVETLFPNPQMATKQTIARGLTFTRELIPAGGTAIHPALDRALGQKVDTRKPHQVIFVTDGIPTVGNTDPSAIVKMVKQHAAKNKGRVFTFGVGYDVNTTLLDGIAMKTRARADYVKPEEKLETAVAALYTRISSPILTDIKIDFGKTRVYDMYPTPIPDLFRGDQVVLFGRYRGDFANQVKVTGTAGLEKKEYVFGGNPKSKKAPARRSAPAANFIEPLEFLPKLWATRKVGYLLEQIRVNGELPELKTEVVRLAQKFGLVTPYTSYLAVDDSEFNQDQQVRPPRTPRPRPMMRDRRDRNEELSGRIGRGEGREDAPAAEPADLGLDRTLAQKGGSKRPAAPSKLKADKKAFQGFRASTGSSSVRAAEKTREYKEADNMRGGDDLLTRRYVGGLSFGQSRGYWVQDGVKVDSKKIIVVEAYSTRYFQLLRKHAKLRRALALGERVIVKLDGRVYKFVPPKK